MTYYAIQQLEGIQTMAIQTVYFDKYLHIVHVYVSAYTHIHTTICTYDTHTHTHTHTRARATQSSQYRCVSIQHISMEFMLI